MVEMGYSELRCAVNTKYTPGYEDLTHTKRNVKYFVNFLLITSSNANVLDILG